MVFLPGTSCLLGEGGKTVECKLTSVLNSIKLKHLRHLQAKPSLLLDH